MKHLKTFESFINEARISAYRALEEIVKGNTSRAEGIKMSKALAQHYLDWLQTSPYGKKYGMSTPLNIVLKASFNFGIERGLDSKLKGELESLKGSISESFLNEAKDSVTFSVRDEKLDQLLHDKHGRELDYVTIKGDEFYSLPKREFDRFIAAADSKGFGEEDWSYYEESVNHMNEAKSFNISNLTDGLLLQMISIMNTSNIKSNDDLLFFKELVKEKMKRKLNEAKSESGLMVFGKTNLDNNKIGDWLDDSDYTAEWNAREGYWLFPEKEDGYDALEAELEKAFTKARINARFEGIF